MTRSEQIGELAAALAKAQGEMTGAKKDSDNPFFRSKYADLASVVAAIQGPFAANGLAYVQCPEPCEGEEVAVDTVLMHASGQWIASRTVVPVTKKDAQGYGSALTYARRYGLQAMAGVASEDDDGNAAAASRPAPKSRRTAVDREDTAASPGVVPPAQAETEGERLFPTPADEERAEKIAVLERVAKGCQTLGLSADETKAKWLKHSGGVGPVMDPDAIGLDALNALLDELLALASAQRSRAKR
jgi:hypothetical protein